MRDVHEYEYGIPVHCECGASWEFPTAASARRYIREHARLFGCTPTIGALTSC